MDMEVSDLNFSNETNIRAYPHPSSSCHNPSFRNVPHWPRYGVSLLPSPCSCQYYKRTPTELTNPWNDDDVGEKTTSSLLKGWYCFLAVVRFVSSEMGARQNERVSDHKPRAITVPLLCMGSQLCVMLPQGSADWNLTPHRKHRRASYSYKASQGSGQPPSQVAIVGRSYVFTARSE